MGTVYLNGRFLRELDACVPVTDRGFLLGDGVYEVIPAYGTHLFALGRHLSRLDASLQGIRLANPLRAAEWEHVLRQLVELNGPEDQSVYVQVTRGPAPRDHAFPAQPQATVLAMSAPLKPPPDGALTNGVAAITLDDIRWDYCHIKSICLLPNVLLRQQAVEAGAAEAILLRDGEVTEGAASTVFAVIEGALRTPPKGPKLLAGITRDVVIELAAAHGMSWQEAPIVEADLRTAEEVWVTSSTREILPVTRLDEQPVGSGRPGPYWARMYRLYQQHKVALRGGAG